VAGQSSAHGGCWVQGRVAPLHQADLGDIADGPRWVRRGGKKGISMKIGRNDPCHCGSGQKYKKCHAAKDEAAHAAEVAAQAAASAEAAKLAEAAQAAEDAQAAASGKAKGVAAGASARGAAKVGLKPKAAPPPGPSPIRRRAV
jgi:hypothetical protein